MFYPYARLIARSHTRRTPAALRTEQALRIQREAEDKFKQFPNRLSSLVNWAMVLHTQNFDFDQARALYKQAAEISPENPVLLRAQAIFMLVSCEPPRQVVFKRAVDMLRSADIRDPKREKFKIAEDSLFHWAVVTNPTDHRALLNYAVLMQGVVKDFDMAEKFYRRALAEAPDDRYVVRNYEDFEAQRLPGGMYAGGGPSINILKNSEVSKESIEWGEWQMMVDKKAKDAKFAHFWYNKISQLTKWEEPDWVEAWQIRIGRSEQTNNFGQWKEYWDPGLKCTFYYNESTDTHQFKNPYDSHEDDGEAEPLALEAGGGGGGSEGSPGPLAISDGKGADSGAMVPYGE
mmetsp:Transcript_9686/g.24827  ORF Transcript_9686/g.24827 Transcript_9686/m.24827 type:complete len:347 (-) Transcript_9686:210-1250(-)